MTSEAIAVLRNVEPVINGSEFITAVFSSGDFASYLALLRTLAAFLFMCSIVPLLMKKEGLSSLYPQLIKFVVIFFLVLSPAGYSTVANSVAGFRDALEESIEKDSGMYDVKTSVIMTYANLKESMKNKGILYFLPNIYSNILGYIAGVSLYLYLVTLYSFNTIAEIAFVFPFFVAPILISLSVLKSEYIAESIMTLTNAAIISTMFSLYLITISKLGGLMSIAESVQIPSAIGFFVLAFSYTIILSFGPKVIGSIYNNKICESLSWLFPVMWPGLLVSIFVKHLRK